MNPKLFQNESKVIPNLSKNESEVNPLEHVGGFPEVFFLRRVLAGVLPPAGQIFEKLHLLKIGDDCSICFCIFQAGC